MHTDLKYFLCTGRKLTLDDQQFTPYVVRAFHFGCLGDLKAIGKHTSYYRLPGMLIGSARRYTPNPNFNPQDPDSCIGRFEKIEESGPEFTQCSYFRLCGEWILSRVGKWICFNEHLAYSEDILEFAMNYTEIAMEADRG